MLFLHSFIILFLLFFVNGSFFYNKQENPIFSTDFLAFRFYFLFVKFLFQLCNILLIFLGNSIFTNILFYTFYLLLCCFFLIVTFFKPMLKSLAFCIFLGHGIPCPLLYFRNFMSFISGSFLLVAYNVM